MYHDPNFDWKAHYKAVRARINSPQKRQLPKPVETMELAAKIEVAPEPKKITGPRDWIFVETPSRKHGFKHIVRQVAAKYGVSELDIISARRTKDVMIPRHEVFYRMRTETTLSFPQIARQVGGRDHTTAYHAYHKYIELLAAGKVTL